jgi:hypothetical protein
MRTRITPPLAARFVGGFWIQSSLGRQISNGDAPGSWQNLFSVHSNRSRGKSGRDPNAEKTEWLGKLKQPLDLQDHD